MKTNQQLLRRSPMVLDVTRPYPFARHTRLKMKPAKSLNNILLVVALILVSPAAFAQFSWTNLYNGPGNGDDRANAMAVDGGGNIYVTGYAWNGTNNDYATVAYTSAGVALWTNRYNGPGNDYDVAYAIAVDGDGVYVTGESFGGGAYVDYATIAYNSAGVALWTNRYDGFNYADVANAIAVDGNGHVYVTGRSSTELGSYYATVAYTSAGTALWTNRYAGPVGGFNNALAIATHTNGHVYVTGYSQAGGIYDYATIAYNPAGVALWTNRYDGPGHRPDIAKKIAVDKSGNVYVTGNSADTNGPAGTNDFATVAYNSAGLALWTNRYNGPGNGHDNANAITVNESGNVYVTGSSVGIGGSADYATVVYSSAGVPQWTNRYDGPANLDDRSTAIVLDGNGNVYVAGYSDGGATSNDFATVVYSGAGMALWTNRYDGPGNSDDRVTAMVVDGTGNVYVAGYSTGANNDYAVIKYAAPYTPLLISQCITNLMGGKQLELQIGGQVGTNYILQAASNLIAPVQWVPMATNTPDIYGVCHFSITNLTGDHLFLRVALP